MSTKSSPLFTKSFVLIALLVLLGAIWITGSNTPSIDASAARADTTATPTPASSTAQFWPTAGWRTSTPAEQGMDADKIAALLEAAKDPKYGLHSLLIIRNGYLVSENYYRANTESTIHELYSCTKSFIATLIGIAVDKGQIDKVSRPLVSFFPDRTIANRDAQKEAITLEHVLTMQAGLDWDEDYISSMYNSSDWVDYMLAKTMKTQPGTQFNYCTGCSHVLSAIIQQKTGLKTQDFAKKELFEPLGITNFYWPADRKGISFGGWGLQITPRDMAKLGYLYLHNGEWDGKQIVSAAWVKAATTAQTKTDSKTVTGYGYQWWIYPSLDAYSALGRDGQTIFVAPKLNLIVVTTAQTKGHDDIFAVIEKYIIPATPKS